MTIYSRRRCGWITSGARMSRSVQLSPRLAAACGLLWVQIQVVGTVQFDLFFVWFLYFSVFYEIGFMASSDFLFCSRERVVVFVRWYCFFFRAILTRQGRGVRVCPAVGCRRVSGEIVNRTLLVVVAGKYASL